MASKFIGDHSGDGSQLTNLSGSALPEFIEEKHIYTSNDSNAVFMPMVKGGLYGTGQSSVTGFIKIKSPLMARTNSMLSMSVDVYEYATGESCSFRISGYSYGDGTWHNCSVTNVSDNNMDWNVRFVTDTDNNQYIAIGETSSTWSYPQVIVRDVLGGYSTSEAEMLGEFVVTYETTMAGTVRHTFSNNQPYAHWDRIEGKPAVWHSTNDGAGSGLDADLLDGMQTVSGSTYNGRIPFIAGDGVMEIGRYVDMHTTGSTADYDIRLNCSSATTLNIDGGSLIVSGDVTAYSDERLKSDVVTIEGALDKVSAMRGVMYTKDDKASTGVIAQEVEAVLPEVVHTADDEMGTKSVAYGNMVGLLIEGMKELKARVEVLEKENAELRNK